MRQQSLKEGYYANSGNINITESCVVTMFRVQLSNDDRGLLMTLLCIQAQISCISMPIFHFRYLFLISFWYDESLYFYYYICQSCLLF